MPRVRFLAPVATAERSYHEREVADIAGAHASAWAKAGLVEIVRGSEEVEQPPAVHTVETPERGREVQTPERTAPAAAPDEKPAPKPRKAATPKPRKRAATKKA